MTNSKLKILVLAPTPYFADRGCHVRIYEEARALTSLGHDVRIVAYHIGRDMPGIPTYRIPRFPWYRKLSAGPSWHKPYLDIFLFFKALRLARSFKPDLIHAHLHEGAFIGLFLKKMLGIPLLFDCQGSLTGEIVDHGFTRSGSFLCACFSRLERWINKTADFIITSSGYGASDLADRWGVPGDKVRAMMDGVDTKVFRPYPKREARERLGLPLDLPIVVFLGLLNRYQGVDLLLSAIAMLKKRGSIASFLLMGFPDGPYREKAEEMGLSDMIHFTGKVDYSDAPLLLSAGDIAVSPKISVTEANGKLFNYMACGLPTVVFDTPVNREILGDAGVYAIYGDVADLAAKMESLLADPERTNRLGGESLKRAAQEHSWEARGRALCDIYRQVLDAR